MSDQPPVDDLDFSDAELLQVLKNHGIDRRLLLKLLGGGAATAALGGTASADPGDGLGIRIDDVFGAPYAAGDRIPSGKVDHQVGLHAYPPEGPGGEPEFFFDPVGLHAEPGDVVQFVNVPHETPMGLFAAEHTVTAFHDKFDAPPVFDYPHRVPEGVPGFTSPVVMGNESWLYQFTETGVYDLFCLPHLSFGMVIRIVVVDPKHDDPAELDDYSDDIPDPIGVTPGDESPVVEAVLTDPALDPTNVVEEGEISWHHYD